MGDSEIHQVVRVSSRRCRSSCLFKWEISDFDTVCPKDAIEIQRITSPAFTAGGDIGQKTQWCVSVAGIGGDLTCSLYRLSVIAVETHVMLCKYKICLGSTENPSVVTESGEHKFKQEDGGWGCEMLKVIGIYENEQRPLLEGNKLRLHLQMEIGANMDCTITSHKSNKRKFDQMTLDTLQKDMHRLFQSSHFSDVKIRCGETCFDCHKLILAARSKVLKAMLDSDMTESVQNEILIEDIEPTTLTAILQYIYTGQIDLPAPSSWTDIIHGAEKYDLVELKNFSFDRMLETMNQDNVGMIAVAAHGYNAEPEVKEAVSKFYKENIENLMRKETFRKLFLEHPTIFYN